jgi:hypothetical protein
MRDHVSPAAVEGHDRQTSGRGRLEAPARPDPAACDLYGPGHQMHYRHQATALRSPATAARFVSVDGVDLTVELEDGRVLRWRHHDPERLERLLDLVPGSRVAYLDEHAFRVGPYWFNCAPADAPWSDCTSG